MTEQAQPVQDIGPVAQAFAGGTKHPVTDARSLCRTVAALERDSLTLHGF